MKPVFIQALGSDRNKIMDRITDGGQLLDKNSTAPILSAKWNPFMAGKVTQAVLGLPSFHAKAAETKQIHFSSWESILSAVMRRGVFIKWSTTTFLESFINFTFMAESPSPKSHPSLHLVQPGFFCVRKKSRYREEETTLFPAVDEKSHKFSGRKKS